MQILTAQSRAIDVTHNVSEIATALDIGIRGKPDFLALHFGPGSSGEAVRSVAEARLGVQALHGGSSLLGIMIEVGLKIDTCAGLGALAILDAAGNYGTGSADLANDPAQATCQANQAALIGPETPIVGDSAADNDVSGNWSQFRPPPAKPHPGVVVSVLFPAGRVSSAYQSGYAPTGISGIVIRVIGRRLFGIDNLPAAQVYHC